MFKVFLDGSGHHRSSSLLTVAACVATPTEWKRFEHLWRQTLKEADLEYFHAKSRSSDKLRGPLLKLVRRAPIPFAVVASIDPRDYAIITNDPYRSVMGNAIAACAMACAFQVHNWTMRHGGGASLYVFESGDPGLEHIHRLFTGLVRASRVEGKWRIAGVSVVDKREFPELAAPDSLAHAKSTGDAVWLNRWKQHCDVVDYSIPPDELRHTAEDIRRLIHLNRSRRRRATRSAKKE